MSQHRPVVDRLSQEMPSSFEDDTVKLGSSKERSFLRPTANKYEAKKCHILIT